MSTLSINPLIEKVLYEKLQIKIGAHLGSGSHGSAYIMNNHTVIKYTGDVSEADACSKIVGMKLKNVCNVYRVFSLKNTSGYFIVQEFCNPVQDINLIMGMKPISSATIIKRITTFKKIFGLIVKAMKSHKNEYQMITKALTENPNEFFHMLLWNFTESNQIEALKYLHDELSNKFILTIIESTALDMYEFAPNSMKLKNLTNGLIELKNVGITFWDTHSDNIKAKSNGDLCFIDLGQSKGGAHKKIEMIEQVVDEICENILNEQKEEK